MNDPNRPRIVRIEGNEMLPECVEPMFPEFNHPAEYVRVIPPVYPDHYDTRYWCLRAGGKGYPIYPHNLIFEGAKTKFTLDNGPIPLKYDSPVEKLKPLKSDFWEDYIGVEGRNASYRLCSRRFLDILLEQDPGTIKYQPLVIKGSCGNIFDDSHYVFTIARIIKAVDYANSGVTYASANPETNYPRQILSFNGVRIRQEIDPDYKLFSQYHEHRNYGQGFIIKDAFKSFLEKQKPQLKNLRFSKLFGGI